MLNSAPDGWNEKAPLIERAREAFAAYRGLGREIIDELIFALAAANREVERLNRRLSPMPAQIPGYKAFANELINADGWGSDWDGGSIQDLAVKHGILREVAYDPDVYGPNDIDAEPGDSWFVFVEEQ